MLDKLRYIFFPFFVWLHCLLNNNIEHWKTRATLPLHFRTTFIPLCETKFSVQIVVCPPPHLVLSRGGERAPQNITEKIFITCKKETVLSGITFSFLFAVVNISMGSPVSPYYYCTMNPAAAFQCHIF